MTPFLGGQHMNTRPLFVRVGRDVVAINDIRRVQPRSVGQWCLYQRGKEAMLISESAGLDLMATLRRLGLVADGEVDA